MPVNISILVDIIRHTKCEVRMKVKKYAEPEAWGNYAIIPMPTYIEVNGPWPLREVEWLEINPIVVEHIGRLAPRVINSLPETEAKMREAALPYTVSEGIIRVSFLDTTC